MWCGNLLHELLHSDSGEYIQPEYSDQYVQPLAAVADQMLIKCLFSSKTIQQKLVFRSLSVEQTAVDMYPKLVVPAELANFWYLWTGLSAEVCSYFYYFHKVLFVCAIAAPKTCFPTNPIITKQHTLTHTHTYTLYLNFLFLPFHYIWKYFKGILFKP